LAKKGIRRFALALLTFLPPILIALSYPGAFISALVYAGGIGCALLLGLLPTLMVWIARKRGEDGPQLLGGGKPLLLFLMLFSLFEVAMELFLELL
jgi:tyrosine-specific transport protein